MGSILERLKKNSTIKEAAVLEDSKFFNEKDMVRTAVMAMNIALSGDPLGGLTPGLTVLAGPSKHFKTSLALLNAKAYLDAHPDAVILFYDSEFGTPQGYFKSFGISTDRVFHTPITDIEQLKFDLMQQLNNIERGDKVIILVDSIGNLASKKEVEDALKQSSAADMTRAKQLKSFFRMVTPYLTIKNIPMVVVNHIYMTQEMFSKPVVSGGTGVYYSADNIIIVGRQQEKEGAELVGYNFILNVEKSRFVKEKSKIPLTVKFDGGISKWSGLLDMALEFGLVTKPKMGWYTRPCVDNDKNWRASETNSNDFWAPVFADGTFRDMIIQKYRLSENQMVEQDASEEVEEIDE